MFKKIILKAFRAAALTYKNMSDGRVVLEAGEASGALHGDRELKGDALDGESVLDVFSQDPRFKYVVVEGRKPAQCVVVSTSNGKYIVGIDPFDGSLAYEKALRTAGAPFTLVITIAHFVEGRDVNFGDVVAAGIMDFRQGGAWYAEVGVGSFVRRDAKSPFVPAIPETASLVDIGKQFVIFESYYPATRELAAKIFAGSKGYLRSFCSAGWEMAMVSSGDFGAQVCMSQKHHELGAARLIVLLAGGAVIHAVSGEPLDNLPWMHWLGEAGNAYNWDFQTPEITACNLQYAEALFAKIQQFWP